MFPVDFWPNLHKRPISGNGILRFGSSGRTQSSLTRQFCLHVTVLPVFFPHSHERVEQSIPPQFSLVIPLGELTGVSWSLLIGQLLDSEFLRINLRRKEIALIHGAQGIGSSCEIGDYWFNSSMLALGNAVRVATVNKPSIHNHPFLIRQSIQPL